MRARLLGRPGLEVDGEPVRLGPQLSVLLAVLLVARGDVVPVSRLVLALWEEPEASPSRLRTLRSHLSHLRTALAADRPGSATRETLVHQQEGYALRLQPEEVDAVRFEQLLAAGRRSLDQGEPQLAAERLRTALRLWRGPALAGVADAPWAFEEARRLDGLRRLARGEKARAELALGRHAEVVDDLTTLLAEDPDDETVRRHLVLALHRTGQQAEAAAVCRTGLERLAERGLDSPALQRLQRDILTGSAELDWQAPLVRRGPVELPLDVPGFVGRQIEVARLRRRLLAAAEGAGPVVCALDGKPGVGKSALAVHVAHEVATAFPDGVLYAELQAHTGRPADSSLDVLGRFLRALGLPGTEVPTELAEAAARFRAELSERRALIVLDDAAGAAQVRPLLPAGRGCAVLVTSRAPLADLEAGTPLSVPVLGEDDALDLLARFLGAGRVDAERSASRSVVRRCGLLPLAVRVAGARLRAHGRWTVREFDARLADERRRLGELTVGDLDVRASLAVSYDALAPADADTFDLLGRLDLPQVSAEVVAVLAGVDDQEADARLERLATAQLLETPAVGRYGFHDLIRLFARERAELRDPDGERDGPAVAAVLRWYGRTAAAAVAGLWPQDTGAEDVEAFPDRDTAAQWLEAERPAFLEVARRSSAGGRDLAGVGWKLDRWLWRFYDLRSYWTDWETVARSARISAARWGDRAAEAAALGHVGIIRTQQHRFGEAAAAYDASLALRRADGDRSGIAGSLNNLGLLALFEDRLEDAMVLLGEAADIFAELGERAKLAMILHNLGETSRRRGDLDAARDWVDRSIELARSTGDLHEEAKALDDLAEILFDQGRLAEARVGYEASLRLCRTVGDRYVAALCRWGLGKVADAVGDRAGARRELAAALESFVEIGAPEAEQVRTALAAVDGAA